MSPMISDELLKRADILIVDDDQSSVRLLERMLERAGYNQVRSTTDARQVPNMLAEAEPDLILLDLMMPDVDGWQVLDQIREIVPEDTYLPVIMLTGDTRPEPRLRALVAGAKDFLAKPFDQFEALLRIHNLLEARLLFRRLRS
jgi:DNA-binding response OmpR family regulator